MVTSSLSGSGGFGDEVMTCIENARKCDDPATSSYNPQEAFVWYLKAAKLRSPYAQYAVATCYMDGDGVPQNYEEAVAWLRRAAPEDGSGFSCAYDSLGICYQKGRGVPKNEEEAFRLFSTAAKLGLYVSQNRLGDCFRLGKGTPVDMSRAAFWYEKSAEQLDVEALHNIGVCYYYGQGVSKDIVQAYKWIKLTSEAGDDSATKFLEKVRSEMTPSEIERAEQLVADFKKANE